MCCALCKPDPLTGQLTEPIPRAHHLPSPTFPSPLGLSGSLVPHPTTASTQTPNQGWLRQNRPVYGAKTAPPAPPLPKGCEDTQGGFQVVWDQLPCSFHQAGAGARDRGNLSHCCSPTPASLHPGSSGAVCSPEVLQPQNSLRAFISPHTRNKLEKGGKGGGNQQLCTETPQNSSRKRILQGLRAQGP